TNSAMFSFLHKNDSKEADTFTTVANGLKRIYKTKLLPLEEVYKFHDFHSPALEDADFHSKPIILLVGQYSTGKTTFIRYLLESDFPGIHIGPEPTTDKFIAVMHDETEGVVPGNALVVDPQHPFRPLSRFGNAFLNRFQCSTVRNEVLKSITIVDTPGILSGEKQRVDRGYSMNEVIEWFSARVDRIVLLFDAHKLDISDEFKAVIESMKGYEDKIRIVLNKSDMVDSQQLMRVYGALMWSLGKVLYTPEVARVYIGSFWNEPLKFDTNKRLFELESQDLFRDLQSLPRNATLRKLNDLIKRARLAKTHAYIIAALQKQMPSMFGKDSKKKQLIKDLPQVYATVAREHNISQGDLPNLQRMQQALEEADFTKFQPLRERLVATVDGMLSEDIAKLMQMIPQESTNQSKDWGVIAGGAFVQATADNPFAFSDNPGLSDGKFEHEWVVNKFRAEFDAQFYSLGPVDGRLTGAQAKDEMTRSKLPFQQLGKIWKLADYDQDGMLNIEEFALAKYLIQLRLDGHELPGTLPEHLVPPGSRH
uniref:EH domain-containing protein 1 n=2 Tax=Macrostomum lignano TaxID=282301 RepID=A0A1I8JIR2_9PLAT